MTHAFKAGVTLHRVYQDLVRGRSQVRITQSVEPSSREDPVFLIGAYRSGTTLLRIMLDSHKRLACPPETTFLSFLHAMTDDETALRGFEGLGFDKSHVNSRIANFASYFYESYAASAGKERWVDKSPEYVWHAQWLATIFPTAKFISLTRYPFDQVHSHLTSGHDVQNRLAPFAEGAQDVRLVATKYWVEAVRAQFRLRQQFAGSVHQVRYEDLCVDPEGSLRGILAFLGEEWDENVLRFGESQHDYGHLADDRAQTSSRVLMRTGGYRRWPREVLAAATQLAQPEMQVLGWNGVEPSDLAK